VKGGGATGGTIRKSERKDEFRQLCNISKGRDLDTVVEKRLRRRAAMKGRLKIREESTIGFASS